MTLIEFACRGYRFALPLASVRRVVPSAQPMPLPGTPDIILGILDIGGEIVAMINFYRRIGLPFSAIELSQQMILVDIPGFCIGLLVDEVSGVTTRDIKDTLCVPGKLAAADFVEATIRLDDGLCVICDPGKFLFSDEKLLLGEALKHLRHAK